VSCNPNTISDFSEQGMAGSGSSLGIYAKFHTALDSEGIFSLQGGGEEFSVSPTFDPETGEVHSVQNAAFARLDRFALQSVVRSILPESRTAGCLRHPFRPSGKVDVWFSPKHESAAYGGLVTCGSVWACPVCAAKITERRRVEIQTAIAAWEAQGGSVAMLTLTHGHTQGDRLADLLEAEQNALTRFFGCRQGVELMSALHRVGHIRAWEVTHGRKREVNNGWHPHFHILLFLEYHHVGLPWAEDWAYQVWLNACRLSVLPLPSRRHGVTLQDGRKASAYVAKMGQEEGRGWGLESEMTKGHIKRAKDGETPFDFLRACLAGDDSQARALFREFAAAFKGKNQLRWTRGLRERFALADLTDTELAAKQEEDALLLATLTRDDWRVILQLDVRGELLELARHGNVDLLYRFLADIRQG
jgi:Replication protein